MPKQVQSWSRPPTSGAEASADMVAPGSSLAKASQTLVNTGPKSAATGLKLVENSHQWRKLGKVRVAGSLNLIWIGQDQGEANPNLAEPCPSSVEAAWSKPAQSESSKWANAHGSRAQTRSQRQSLRALPQSHVLRVRSRLAAPSARALRLPKPSSRFARVTLCRGSKRVRGKKRCALGLASGARGPPHDRKPSSVACGFFLGCVRGEGRSLGDPCCAEREVGLVPGL